MLSEMLVRVITGEQNIKWRGLTWEGGGTVSGRAGGVCVAQAPVSPGRREALGQHGHGSPLGGRSPPACPTTWGAGHSVGEPVAEALYPPSVLRE